MTSLSYGSALSGHYLARTMSRRGMSHVIRAQIVAIAVDALAALAWQLVTAPMRAHERRRNQAELSGCSDRLLRDIGLERTTLSFHARRVDWQR